MDKFGIPYAFLDADTGEAICPICGLHIPETFDREGEQTSHNYADHYVEQHEDDDPNA